MLIYFPTPISMSLERARGEPFWRVRVLLQNWRVGQGFNQFWWFAEAGPAPPHVLYILPTVVIEILGFIQDSR